MNGNYRRGGGTGPGVLAVFGVIFLITGIALCYVRFAFGTVSQWNGRCTSAFGKFSQVLLPPLAHGCGLAAIGDRSIGWLIGGGAAFIVLAIILRSRQRRSPPMATRTSARS
jgi:hypothetical protein